MRNRLGIFACVVLLAVPLAADGFGDPIHGQTLFVTKGCVECHAVRGAGGRIGPDLGRSTVVKGSFYELVSAMWNHSPVMMEKMRESRLTRPTFSDDELSDLLAFLYFLNYFDEPGDPRNGQTLFAEKHCVQCHAIGKEGGSTGPRLDTLARGTSPLQIAQNLWNHGPVMIPMMHQRNLTVPTFRGSEIVDLFAYLRIQGRRQASRDFRSAGDAQHGKQVFETRGCSRCHAVFGSGGGIGPDLGRVELRGSVTQLAGRMWNHWPAMSDAMEAIGLRAPVFRGDEMADVFAYLFVSRYDGEGGQRDDGLAVYNEKGCGACHGRNGEGGNGPRLRELTTGEEKETIAQRMWNHAPAMWATMEKRKVAWPRFEPQELASLLRFLAEEWQNGTERVRPKTRIFAHASPTTPAQTAKTPD